MQLNNSGRLCVIIDSDTHDITAYSPWSQGHHHVHFAPSTWTRAWAPLPASSLSHRSMVEFSPPIYVSYYRQAQLGPFWRQQTYCTPLRISPPCFPVTHCDSLTRTLSSIWPTLEYRECGGLWIVGEDSSPVSRLLSSLCPGIVRHDESLPDIAHPSVNSLTLHSLANALTETAGCIWLRVWPTMSRHRYIQENRHVWQAALFSPEMHPVGCWWIIYVSQAEHGDLEAGVRGGN